MPAARKRSLQVHEDLPFERRQWRIQRVAWCGMALILLLALLGMFGNGPLSHAQVRAPGLQVKYDRFVHANASTRLRVLVTPSGGAAQLAVNRAYLDAMPVQHIQPEPAGVDASGDTLIFAFTAASTDPIEITLELRPMSPGGAHALIRRAPALAENALRFSQFIYP